MAAAAARGGAPGSVVGGCGQWAGVKRKDRPPEYWAERRRAKNRHRSEKWKAARRERGAAAARAREAALEGLEEAERQAALAELKAEKVRREEQQQEAVQEALGGSGQRICVECAFEGLGAHSANSAREVSSLYKQLEHVVAANRRARVPANASIHCWRGALAELAQSRAAGGWKSVHLRPDSALEAFPREELVWLTPDSDTPLMDLDPKKVYCIGGIVDRTVAKGHSLRWAQEHSLATARLPFPEVLGDEAPKKVVLNVNAVARILLHVLATPGDWRGAFEVEVPGRYQLGQKSKAERRGRKGGAAAPGKGDVPAKAGVGEPRGECEVGGRGRVERGDGETATAAAEARDTEERA